MPSLRARYFSLTLILSTLVIGFVFNTYLQLSEKNQIATRNLSDIDSQFDAVDKIRHSIANIYRTINLFLLNPKEKGYIKTINDELLSSRRQAENIDFGSTFPTAENTLSLQDQALNSFTLLQPLLVKLVKIRTDPNLQYPGMSLSANIMDKQQAKTRSLLTQLQEEIENGYFKPSSRKIYSEILEARILVEKEVSQSRTYIANRSALFSKEILVSQALSLIDFHRSLLTKLIHLKDLYKNETGSFEGTDNIDKILSLQKEWYTNFKILRETSESDRWKTDSLLMEKKISPIITKTSQLLHEYNEHLRQEKKNITATFKDNSKKLFYVLSIIIAIFIIFISVILFSLELMIFKPILDIANVMKLKAFGQSNEQFSENQSQETQNIVTAFNELEKQVNQHSKELHLAIEKAITAKDEARSANAAKSTFLTNMSHELRTPLHGILSFSELGVSKASEIDEEKALMYFDAIHQSGKRLLFLLSDLLDLARLETEKNELCIQKKDLNQTTSYAIRQFKQQSEEKDLIINIHCENTSLNAEFDEDMIIQVINNLLSNSVKYTPENKIIDIYLSCENIKNKDTAKFMIQDNGIGIPEGEFNTIFDKFIESSMTQSGAGGTGLGLAICSQIIKLHQGSIYTQKMDKQGSCFIFTFPVIQE